MFILLLLAHTGESLDDKKGPPQRYQTMQKFSEIPVTLGRFMANLPHIKGFGAIDAHGTIFSENGYLQSEDRKRRKLEISSTSYVDSIKKITTDLEHAAANNILGCQSIREQTIPNDLKKLQESIDTLLVTSSPTANLVGIDFTGFMEQQIESLGLTFSADYFTESELILPQTEHALGTSQYNQKLGAVFLNRQKKSVVVEAFARKMFYDLKHTEDAMPVNLVFLAVDDTASHLDDYAEKIKELQTITGIQGCLACSEAEASDFMKKVSWNYLPFLIKNTEQHALPYKQSDIDKQLKHTFQELCSANIKKAQLLLEAVSSAGY